MSDTDGMVKLMEHAADLLGAACDRLAGRKYDTADRATLDTVIAALACGKATLSVVAASVTPAPSLSGWERRYLDGEPMHCDHEAWEVSGSGHRRCVECHEALSDAGMSEVERREYFDAHRDELVEPGSGVPIEPKVLGQVMSVRLPSDMALALRDHADSIGQSASDVVRGAVTDLLRRYKPKGEDRG